MRAIILIVIAFSSQLTLASRDAPRDWLERHKTFVSSGLAVGLNSIVRQMLVTPLEVTAKNCQSFRDRPENPIHYIRKSMQKSRRTKNPGYTLFRQLYPKGAVISSALRQAPPNIWGPYYFAHAPEAFANNLGISLAASQVVSSAVLTGAESVLLSPIEVVRDTLMTNNSKKGGIKKTLYYLKVTQPNIIPRFYPGVVPIALKRYVHNLSSMASLYIAREFLEKYTGRKERTAFEHALTGVFTGACVTLATYPLDTVKTRRQGVLRDNRAVHTMLVQLFKEHGRKGLLSGASLIWIRNFYSGFLYSVLISWLKASED